MPYGLIMEFPCVLKVPKNIFFFFNEYFQDSKTYEFLVFQIFNFPEVEIKNLKESKSL